jgi:hypothetical protein
MGITKRSFWWPVQVDVGLPPSSSAQEFLLKLPAAALIPRRCASAGEPGRQALSGRRVLGWQQAQVLPLPSSGRDVRFIARPPPRTVHAACPHTAPTSGV